MNFLIKNWVFLIIILIIVIGILVGMKFKSWEAVGSIGTFLMTIATFITLWWYRKEKEERENREISEKIIQPLKENLRWIIEYIPKGQMNNWQWQEIKKNNYYLILRMDQQIKARIEKFNEDWEKFKNLFYQRWNRLNELFDLEIFNYFHKQSSSKSQKVLQSLSQLAYSKDSVRNWYYFWQVGGKDFSVNFFDLIFWEKSLKEFIEESKNESTIFNREIGDKRCVIANVKIEESDFEKIADSIRKKIQEEKYMEYFNFSHGVYSRAKDLLKRLESLRI